MYSHQVSNSNDGLASKIGLVLAYEQELSRYFLTVMYVDLGKVWCSYLHTTGILLYAKVCPLYNVLWEYIVVIYT